MQKPPPNLEVIAFKTDITLNNWTIEMVIKPEKYRRNGRNKKSKIQFDTLLSDKKIRFTT